MQDVHNAAHRRATRKDLGERSIAHSIYHFLLCKSRWKTTPAKRSQSSSKTPKMNPDLTGIFRTQTMVQAHSQS